MKEDLLCLGLERKPNGIAFKERLPKGHLKRSVRFKENLFGIKIGPSQSSFGDFLRLKAAFSKETTDSFRCLSWDGRSYWICLSSNFFLPCVKGSPKARCLNATSSVMSMDKRSPARPMAMKRTSIVTKQRSGRGKKKFSFSIEL